MEMPLPADPAEVSPAVFPDVLDAQTPAPQRRGAGIWALLLILVVAVGYLTASRREALGTLFNQIADIARDFRGYDPPV